MLLNEILEAIKGLSEEEQAAVKDALTSEEVTEPSVETTEQAAESTEENPVAESTEELEEEVAADDAEPSDESMTEETTGTAEDVEPIPDMAIPEQFTEVDETTSLQDEQGEEMPVDYSQIVEGQNARILALEAENKQLKTKIDGAFGLVGKPGALTSVNNLYGDTSDIPTMRK